MKVTFCDWLSQPEMVPHPSSQLRKKTAHAYTCLSLVILKSQTESIRRCYFLRAGQNQVSNQTSEGQWSATAHLAVEGNGVSRLPVHQKQRRQAIEGAKQHALRILCLHSCLGQKHLAKLQTWIALPILISSWGQAQLLMQAAGYAACRSHTHIRP